MTSRHRAVGPFTSSKNDACERYHVPVRTAFFPITISITFVVTPQREFVRITGRRRRRHVRSYKTNALVSADAEFENGKARSDLKACLDGGTA